MVLFSGKKFLTRMKSSFLEFLFAYVFVLSLRIIILIGMIIISLITY